MSNQTTPTVSIDNVVESIARSSKSLMLKEPFYGMFLISLNKALSTSIPTACVSKNGINTQLTINQIFWSTLDDMSKIAVLKHELLHIAFFHLTNWDKYPDHSLANIAADLEVNQYIEDAYKGEVWKKIGAIEINNFPELNLPPKAGMKKYYELLSQINQNRQQQQGNNGKGKGNESEDQNQNGNGGGAPKEITSVEDLNDMFEKMKNSKSGNDGSSPEKSKIWDYYDQQQQGQPVVCSHELWKQFTEGLSEADRKLIEKQIDHQIKEIAQDFKNKNRGTFPSELQEYIDSLFEVHPPVVDWKAYLRRFGGSSYKIYTRKTRRKENKRYSGNPALKIKPKRHILVGIDTSGSVSNKDLMEFFSEIYNIYKSNVTVDIVECDAAVHRVYEYKGKLPEYISGRGGTHMSPIIEHYNENYKRYNALIILTDGYIESDIVKPRTKMLWVLCQSGVDVENAKHFPGTVVKINYDDEI